MIPETIQKKDNRAVSPWFRVFGGGLREAKAERVKMAPEGAMHRAESVFLGIAIPLVVVAACFDGLSRLAGPWVAWIFSLPVAFLFMHVLVFGLRVGGPLRAFWAWSLLLGAWSGWMISGGGNTPLRWVAWAWLIWLVMQLPALLVLAWRGIMGMVGVVGIVARVILCLAVHAGMVGVWMTFGWPAGLATGLAICGLWALCVFRPRSGIFGPVACRVDGPGVLLTIDDGPHPEDTPAILDLLDEHQVKAVFFVIGDRVKEHPELAREIVARGHELGNHTMTHPQESMWVLGPWRTWREIARCQEVIEEVAGVRPRWFRAPVGHRNYFTHPVAAALGMEVVAWTHRAFDTVDPNVDRAFRRLVAHKLNDGDVILMHENTSIARALAKRIIPECRGSGAEAQ